MRNQSVISSLLIHVLQWLRKDVMWEVVVNSPSQTDWKEVASQKSVSCRAGMETQGRRFEHLL